MITIKSDKVTLPHLEKSNSRSEKSEIFIRFMGHMRHVPVSRVEIKILSAIQFTADMLNSSDAHISKELVEMGLRAPRLAFPIEFLDFIDNSLMRCGWDVGAPSEAMVELREQWFTHIPAGEDQMRLSPFRHVSNIVKEDVLNY